VPQDTQPFFKRRSVEWLTFAAVAGVMSIVISTLAFQRFDFFDMSAFLDAGWRVANGQRIYTDFYYSAGPVHPYLHALFFKIFGFNKTAILSHLLFVHLIVMLSVFLLARTKVSLPLWVVLLVLTSLSFAGTVAHPWYDLTAAAAIVAAVALLDLTTRARETLRDVAAPALCGALLAVSFMSKFNVGAAGGVAVLAVTLAARSGVRSRAVSVASYVVGGVVGVGLFLATLASPSDFYGCVTSFSTSGRFSDTARLIETLLCLQTLLPLAAVLTFSLLAGTDAVRRNPFDLVGAVALSGVTAISAWTGSMAISAWILLAGPTLALCARMAYQFRASPEDASSLRVRRAMRIIAGALAGLLVGLAWNSRLIVWSWRPSNTQINYALTTPGFEGWACNAAVGVGVDRVVAKIKEVVPPEESLMVFPDAQVIYGMTDRVAPAGVPFIFHFGLVPPAGRFQQQFLSVLSDRPPNWVVLHDQQEIFTSRLEILLPWLGLEEFFKSQYETVWQAGDFSLLRRRPAN